nr:hypothetical protein [Tanacetum cinerariifolium]
MHNNIIAAGSRDRPPMLATRRFSQWQSRFLRFIDTRPNGDALRKCILQGKEIGKPITPSSESASKEDNDPEQAQRDNDMQKNLALIAKYKNDNQTGQFRNQRKMTVVGARETVGSQKAKKVKDYTYHMEKMLLCKQAKKGVPLQAEQADWIEDTDEEIDEQQLEAHYNYMAKI